MMTLGIIGLTLVAVAVVGMLLGEGKTNAAPWLFCVLLGGILWLRGLSGAFLP